MNRLVSEMSDLCAKQALVLPRRTCREPYGMLFQVRQLLQLSLEQRRNSQLYRSPSAFG